jgi:hypothetical protein
MIRHHGQPQCRTTEQIRVQGVRGSGPSDSRISAIRSRVPNLVVPPQCLQHRRPNPSARRLRAAEGNQAPLWVIFHKDREESCESRCRSADCVRIPSSILQREAEGWLELLLSSETQGPGQGKRAIPLSQSSGSVILLCRQPEK